MNDDLAAVIFNESDDDIIDTTNDEYISNPIDAVNVMFDKFAATNPLFIIPNSFMVTVYYKDVKATEPYKNKPTISGEEIILKSVKRGKKKDHIFVFDAIEHSQPISYEIGLEEAVIQLPGFEDHLINALEVPGVTNVHVAIKEFKKTHRARARLAANTEKEKAREAERLKAAEEEEKRKQQMAKNSLWGAF